MFSKELFVLQTAESEETDRGEYDPHTTYGTWSRGRGWTVRLKLCLTTEINRFYLCELHKGTKETLKLISVFKPVWLDQTLVCLCRSEHSSRAPVQTKTIEPRRHWNYLYYIYLYTFKMSHSLQQEIVLWFLCPASCVDSATSFSTERRQQDTHTAGRTHTTLTCR